MSLFVVHGASSAGRTTIAKALQTALGNQCVYVAIDGLWSGVPPRVSVGAKVFGHLTEVLFAQAAQWSQLGYDVVVDTVFEDRANVATCARHVAPDSTYLVAVMCSVEILEQRETARGNRRAGMARDQASRVHTHVAHDVSVDSGKLSPDECVEAILTAARVPPRALESFVAGGVDPLSGCQTK